jgi:transcriptional regulator with GAF, ATPase, and Fis domain
MRAPGLSRRVDVAFCAATNKDLRALVSAATRRENVYFRVGIAEVVLPPPRNRPEAIPALLAHELAKLLTAPTAHLSLVEQCLLRP